MITMDLGSRSLDGASLVLTQLVGATNDVADRIRVIVRMQTTEECRRKGAATRLLKQVCGEADLYETVLVLTPAAFLDAPIDDTHLAAWYRRFGFNAIQTEPVVLMARQFRKTPHGRTH